MQSSKYSIWIWPLRGTVIRPGDSNHCPDSANSDLEIHPPKLWMALTDRDTLADGEGGTE